MAEPVKLDGLEIISIGTLYVGPWDKKYWSSSRGKDRYPYPVGYQAIRTNNGIVYKVEIHEGSKGPMFQINSTNKQFSCGPTPDIAWENFQKKGCSRIKLWNGKRFSCKIDGAEFFGFRNALVQRLLREILVNVSGAFEQSMLPTNICNRSPAKEHDDMCSDACKYPDLKSDLAKPQVTGKRSRKLKGISVNSVCGVGPEGIQPQSWVNNCDTSNDKPINQVVQKYENYLNSASMSVEYNLCKDTEKLLSVPINLKPGKDVFVCNFNKVSADPVKELSQIQERSELLKLWRYMSPTLINADLPDIEGDAKLGDRSQLLDAKSPSLSLANADGLGESLVHEEACNPSVMNDSEANNCSHLYAPDTLEENFFGQDTRWIKELCGVKNDHPNAASAHVVLPEIPNSKTHQEEETETCKLIGSSERSDFDSVGEEMAKSMIKLLLPRAVPLLKYSSRKKKRKVMKDIPPQVQTENESNVNDPPMCLASPGILKIEKKEVQKEMMTMNASFGSTFSVLEKSVAPDSLEYDHHEDPAINQMLLFSDVPVAVGAKSGEDDHILDSKGSPVVPEAVVCATNESSPSPNETCNETVQPEQLKNAPEEMHPHTVLSLDSALYRTPSVMKVLDGRSLDYCLNSEAVSRPLEIQLMEDFDTSHLYTEDTIQSNSMRLDADSGKTTEAGKDGTADTVFNLSPAVTSSSGKYYAPLIESFTCRNITEDYVPETQHTAGNLFAPDSCQVSSSIDTDDKKASAEMKARAEGELANLHNEKKHEAYNDTSPASHDQKSSPTFHERIPYIIDKSALPVEISQPCMEKGVNVELNLVTPDFPKPETSVYNTLVSCSKEVQVATNVRSHSKDTVHNDLEGSTKFVGCYSHSMPISSLMLARKVNEVYVCVICSLPEEQKRNLFLYKLPIQESSQGHPSFIGHTMIEVPVLNDTFGGEIAVDKSGLQFTPDAQGLILLDDIEVPYCRTRKCRCQCSTCVSYCFEENAVKIVQVNTGYVTLILKLKTVYRIHCILVCEPEHLVAVDQSGRFYIWVMNPTWSGYTKEYVIPSYDLVASRVVELRRIPECETLVVGHNGCGEFSLWDLTRRTVLSRFSSPSPIAPILEFLPLSVFSFPISGLAADKLDIKEHMNKLVEAISMQLSQQGQTRHFSSLDGDDIAVWLLIRTLSDTEGQLGYPSCNSEMNQAGCWRLGLLVKKRLIFGNVLDPRTAAIGVSAGLGIIGTQDGLVYLWDLPTGTVVRSLQNFEGRISHIATADALPAVIAIAGEDGRLFVYLHRR